MYTLVVNNLVYSGRLLGMPLTTFCLVMLMSLLFAAGLLFPGTEALFALVPGRTFGRFHLWNGATASLYEASPLFFAANVVAVRCIGRVLEPVWRAPKMLRALAVALLASGAASFAWACLDYARRLDVDAFFAASYGADGVVAALLVGLKQEFPGRSLAQALSRTPALPVRAGDSDPAWDPRGDASGGRASGGRASGGRASGALAGLLGRVGADRAALAHCAAQLAFAALGLRRNAAGTLVAAFAAWAHLRFYARNPDGTVGDPGPDFALATLFPEAVQRPVRLLVRATGVCGRLCGCRAAAGGRGGRSDAARRDAALSAREIAERRRARALRALDEKLAEIARLPGSELDGDEDGDEEDDALTMKF
jgi:hypothetical protein